jgi:PAS domain S-box-containing protein
MASQSLSPAEEKDRHASRDEILAAARAKTDTGRSACESQTRRRLENTPGFAIIFGSKGEIEDASEQFLRFLGKTLAEVRECTLSGLNHPNDSLETRDLVERAVASGDTYEVELRLQGSAGQYRWFHASGIPLRATRERTDLWYVLLIDIDDRKRINVDLSERERQFRRSEAVIAEGERLSHTGSFYWNTESNEILFSEEAYRIHEIEPGTIITLELVASCIHPEDRPLLQQKIDAGRNDRGDLSYLIRLQLPSKGVRWLQTTARRFENKAGAIEYVGACQDITDRRNSEEALNKLRSEMAHVTRISSLGALAASIAHEVNQPLTGVITNASTGLKILNADPPNVSLVLETVRRTLRDANRASNIVARLRAMFSNQESECEYVDLNSAVREIMSLSVGELQLDGVMVHMELDPALPTIRGDRVQLQQVILNLILNASEAMKDIATRPRKLMLKTALEDDAALRLTVADSGTGIEPVQAVKVFEPFYTTKNKGMGIGLFISRSIIERHGGRLWAERNEPDGARFCFSIPLPKPRI